MTNLRDLAKRFNSELEYFVIYKQYSIYIHGTDYQRFIKRMNPKFQYKYILRDRNLMKEIPGLTGNWMLSIINLIFEFFLPDKKVVLKDWYIKNIGGYTKFIWKEEIKSE